MGGLKLRLGIALALILGSVRIASAEPLAIGYSDWPGFVAWQVAIDKGWIKDAGLDVKFEWFDYSASLDAFSAKKLDAVLATNGDTLAIGAGGGVGTIVMITDYSSGNDQIIAVPGVKTVKDLAGKKVGVEVGLVDHLLLDKALEDAGLTEKDVTLVNAKTNDLPQVLGSGEVSAVAAWQPSSGIAVKSVPGSKAIYTSASAPGLIYDVLTVSPTSLASKRADWVKLIKIWDKTVAYINDPATQDDAVKIMSARDGLTPEAYKAFLEGTHLLDLKAGAKAYQKGSDLSSIYFSTKNADDFNVRNAVYKTPLEINGYIDGSLTADALK